MLVCIKCILQIRRYRAEILPIRRKTPSNQSINHILQVPFSIMGISSSILGDMRFIEAPVFYLLQYGSLTTLKIIFPAAFIASS